MSDYGYYYYGTTDVPMMLGEPMSYTSVHTSYERPHPTKYKCGYCGSVQKYDRVLECGHCLRCGAPMEDDND